jgi:hypothetical protein
MLKALVARGKTIIVAVIRRKEKGFSENLVPAAADGVSPRITTISENGTCIVATDLSSLF